MNNIQILDCTLRDGGYVNDFRFGKEGIRRIISKLTVSGIDIVECGFLEDGDYDEECSIYNRVEQIGELLPKDRGNTIYVAMACYGEYDINQLSAYDGSSIDGIRVSFHRHEVKDAMDYCRQIMAKGYKVFIQPVGTTSYSDEQLIELIQAVNDLNPYAFYMVDTLGLMLKKDVLRLFYLVDQNLKQSIHMGFHSHNNLQLSYSNSQVLAELDTERVISLDASVYGMGRGAGNLNTELIAYYINTKERKYKVEPILEIVDEYISKIYGQHAFGYDVPHYLAAIHGCHPNYAAYYMDKQTLDVRSIGAILRMIEPTKRAMFDKSTAESKYVEYQNRKVDDGAVIGTLKQRIDGRNVLVTGPGSSIIEYEDAIKKVAQEKNCVTISVGFIPSNISCDYAFVSNVKRYHTVFDTKNGNVQLICTSNIKSEVEEDLIVNYSTLLNEDNVIMDNSAMMLLNLLSRLCPNMVYVAGLDGYDITQKNYYQERLSLPKSIEQMAAINKSVSDKIADLKKHMNIVFITPSRYVA